MSKQHVKRVGGSAGAYPGNINISGILNNAMKAVHDAQKAVANIQNIAHVEPPACSVLPDTPTLDQRTGQPKTLGSARSGVIAKRPAVHGDKSTMLMTGGTMINIVNSQNVQIGHNNRMYVVNGQSAHDSSSSEEEEVEDLQTDCRQPRLADEETAEILRDSHRQVSDAELQRLSRHIGGGWRRLIRMLDIEDEEVDYVFMTHNSEGLEEVIYQLLKKWKQEHATPTVGQLINALERADMTRLLHHLKP